MEWSTKATRVDRPFGSWAEDLAAAFVQLEPRKAADTQFHGTISKAEAAPIHVSRVEASGHTVMRQRSHIAKGHSDVYFVNLQLTGLACSTQRGHEQVCGPADLAIVDTTEPFGIVNCRDFALHCFSVPRSLLPASFVDRPRLRLSASETGRALARTMAGYADLCLRSPSAPPAFGTHLLELLLYADATLRDEPAPRARVSVPLAMMLDHIDRHFTDPALDAFALARTFGCSTRYVHKLFGTTDRTVGEHIAQRRLLACARDLLDPSHRGRTIAEIAFAAGFRDISNFNRHFKRSNGMTPSDYRHAASGTIARRCATCRGCTACKEIGSLPAETPRLIAR